MIERLILLTVILTIFVYPIASFIVPALFADLVFAGLWHKIENSVVVLFHISRPSFPLFENEETLRIERNAEERCV